MPEAKQQFPDDYIRRSAEDNLNSRIISPQSPAKSDISNGHVTNVLPFVDLQGPRTAAWPTDNIMNTEELKQHCTKALREVGAPEDYSKFFADVVQTENDIDNNIHNLHGKLSPDLEKNADPDHLLQTIQELTKGYNGWRTEIEVLQSRSKELPPLKIDSNRINQSQAIKALCSIQTKDLKVSPGDEIKILDTTKPNKLKVRTTRGDEGYLPLLSCLLPSPDKNAITAPDRLKLQLLASWRDSMNKSKSCLVKCLVETAKQLNNEWKNKTSIHSTGAKERVSRRLRRLMESLNTQLPNWDLTRLHNALFSIEKELCSWNGAGSANMYGPLFVRDIEPVIKVIASLDKTVLCYQMFRKQWYLYRRSLEQCPRPMRIVDHVNQLRTVKSCKNFRYYEVKVTREEVETVEEIVETKKPRSTVQAEQMTTSSAEERRRFVITGVIDPRSGEEISFQDAVNARIIDQTHGMYVNPNTGGGMSIPEAMNEGRIKVGSSTAEVTKEETKAVGLITIKTPVEHRHMTIKEVTDAVTGKIMSLEEAKKAGIIDESNTHYTLSNTGEKVELEKAIQGGWVTVENESSVTQPEYEIKTYAVNAVVDQVNKRKVPFADAVNLGLIDRDTGNYVNNVTGEKVYVTEAIKRGFLKAHEVDSSDGLNIDTENKVVVERMEKIRRNVLKSMGVIKAFKMGKKKPGEPTSPEPKKLEPLPSTEEQKAVTEKEPLQESNGEVQGPVESENTDERLQQNQERTKVSSQESSTESKQSESNLKKTEEQENVPEQQNQVQQQGLVEKEDESEKQDQEKVQQQQKVLESGIAQVEEASKVQSEEIPKKEQQDSQQPTEPPAEIDMVDNKDMQEAQQTQNIPVKTEESQSKAVEETKDNNNQSALNEDKEVDNKEKEEGKQAQPITPGNVEELQPAAKEEVMQEPTGNINKPESKGIKKPKFLQRVKSPKKQQPEPKPVDSTTKESLKASDSSKDTSAKASPSKSPDAKPEETKNPVNGATSKQENSPQKKKKDKKKSWWKRKK